MCNNKTNNRQAAHLMEAFQMQCDDRRQQGDQDLLPGAGVDVLHLLVYANNTKHTEMTAVKKHNSVLFELTKQSREFE